MKGLMTLVLVGGGAALALSAAPRSAAAAEIVSATQAHNAWRAVVGQPPLVWSDAVAEAAQAYADQLAASETCPLVHASGHAGVLVGIPTAGAQPQAYTGCDPATQVDGLCPCTPGDQAPADSFCVSDGENLFMAGAQLLFDSTGAETRLVQDVDGADVTNSWGSEKQDYTLATDSCAPNATCGHYTQVVWAATQQLGCGRAICGDNAQVWVCRYRPAGNFQVPPYAGSEEDLEVTLLPEKDTSLRLARPDANNGAALALRVTRNTHALVGFSAAVGTLGQNVTAAALALNLRSSTGWPEAGGTVDAHALPQTEFRRATNALGDGRWREGDGNGAAAGSGVGATWNCSRDDDIADNVTSCYPAGLSPPWNGASEGRLAFQAATAPGQLHSNDQQGEVRWDVTADVQNQAASDWLIKLTDETATGVAVRYHAREAGAQGPKLILQLDRNF